MLSSRLGNQVVVLVTVVLLLSPVLLPAAPALAPAPALHPALALLPMSPLDSTPLLVTQLASRTSETARLSSSLPVSASAMPTVALAAVPV